MESLGFISGGDPAAALQGAQAESAPDRELHSAVRKAETFVEDRLR